MLPLAGERWYIVPKGETAQAVRQQKSDFRRQTDIAAGNVFPTYDRDHSAGRFLDCARNDRRAAERPWFRGEGIAASRR